MFWFAAVAVGVAFTAAVCVVAGEVFIYLRVGCAGFSSPRC